MAVPLIVGSSLDTLGQRSFDWGRLDAEMAKARADTELKRIEMMQKAMADAAGSASKGYEIGSNERIENLRAQNQYDLGMAPYTSSTGNARLMSDIHADRIQADREAVRIQSDLQRQIDENNELRRIIEAMRQLEREK